MWILQALTEIGFVFLLAVAYSIIVLAIFGGHQLINKSKSYQELLQLKKKKTKEDAYKQSFWTEYNKIYDNL